MDLMQLQLNPTNMYHDFHAQTYTSGVMACLFVQLWTNKHARTNDTLCNKRAPSGQISNEQAQVEVCGFQPCEYLGSFDCRKSLWKVQETSETVVLKCCHTQGTRFLVRGTVRPGIKEFETR